MVDTIENDGGERKYETGEMKTVQGGDGARTFNAKQFKKNWRRFEIERTARSLDRERPNSEDTHTHH
jgi:hypothetical protein